MLNKCFLMGRLTRDPERRTTESGKTVAHFTVAINRTSNAGGADFLDCVAWEKTAEFVCKHFTKGRMILVEAHAQQRKWTDKEGKSASKLEFIADSVQFADAKPKKDEAANDSGFDAVIDSADDDLPF